MPWWLWALGGLALIGAGGASMTMQYFQDGEFRGWKEKMAPELLRQLDAFRAELGYPVQVSEAPGAIGRNLGPDDTSRHNVDRWGKVQAIDVMPTPVGDNGRPRGMNQAEARQARQLAKEFFGGVGVYPHWQPYPGLHLDVRPAADGDVATWGGLPKPGGQGQDYVAQETALAQWSRYA